MTDNNNVQDDAGSQGAAAGPQFGLVRVYLRDLSFESPLGPEAFKQAGQPQINQDLNTIVNKLDDDQFEVILKITVSATIEDKTIFLVEVQQAGQFLVRQIDPQQMAQLFNTTCPQILFPYAREVVDSCVVKGGFPALALPPINFDVLFMRAVQQAQQAQAAQVEKEGAAIN
jgi:preprotein translocase subunit SecB